jgi:hypothetical protein
MPIIAANPPLRAGRMASAAPFSRRRARLRQPLILINPHRAARRTSGSGVVCLRLIVPGGHMSTAPSSPATSSEFGTLSEEHWIEPLNDGSHVLIRPLKPEDRQREADFIAGLSAEARHFRFLCSMREVSPALLDQLMAVNFKDSVAYIAVAHQDGKLIEVGVSRYAVGGDGEECECAITVADAWRHRAWPWR